MIKQLLTLLLALIFISGCKKTDPKINVPSYLEISGYTFNALTGEGTASHNFTDVGVYISGEFLGVFPIPCKIPFDKEGVLAVKLKPYIKVNGVSSVRSEYNFVQYHNSDQTFVRGQITSMSPVFEYTHVPGRFKWLEDFEGNGYSLVPAPGTDTSTITFVTSEKYEGVRCMSLKPTADDPIVVALSSSSYALPFQAAPIYLELHYKTNQEFQVGLMYGTTDLGIVGGVRATTGWSKIYLFLTPYINSTPAPAYKIYFRGLKDSGVLNSEIYIDNIKLLAQ